MSYSGNHPRFSKRKDESYDAGQAYDKNLSSKARMHYLENDIADHKGMSRYGSDHGDSPAKGLKERVVRRQGKVDAARASFGTDNVDGGFDRKLKRLKKSVAKSEKRGMNMDYDTTDASGEGRSRTSTRSGMSRAKYGGNKGDDSMSKKDY